VTGVAKVTVGIPTYNRSALLGEAIESVLGQTYSDLRLVIADNASSDATPEVVARYVHDPRVEYVRHERNIGQTDNFNGLIAGTTTDYLLLLSDDDLLHPTLLESTVAVLGSDPLIGAVHTRFDVVDGQSRVIEHSVDLVPGSGRDLTIETSNEFMTRAMRQNWLVTLAATLFRTEAMVEGDGLRGEEYPVADFSLMLRVGSKWKVAHIPASLASVRVHAEAISASLGSFADGAYAVGDDYAPMMFERRSRFLEEGAVTEDQRRAYGAIAAATYRRDRVRQLRNSAGARGDWWGTTTELVRFAAGEPSILVLPDTWLLLGAQLGGRWAKRLVDRRRVGQAAGGT
jgi:glycosyltransferase involved in cell wall biosynthesis